MNTAQQTKPRTGSESCNAMDGGYRVEAAIKNPETCDGHERGNLHAYQVTEGRLEASDFARTFWGQGYWVEVYDNKTDELLSGPIDPDAALPSYLV